MGNSLAASAPSEGVQIWSLVGGHFPGGSDGKASACNMGDLGSIPELGRFPWRRKWQPTPVLLPRGAWWVIAHGVAKSQTQLHLLWLWRTKIPHVPLPKEKLTKLSKKKKKNQGLPGSSKVKTPYSQCRGWGSSPVRELRSHMTCMAQPDQKKKKKRNKRPSTPPRNLKTKLSKPILGVSLVAEW